MENTIVVKFEPKIDTLTVRALRVMKSLQRELGECSGRVPYGKIAKELGLEWNHVKYDVKRLVKAGVLDVSGGKISILKRIVL